MFSLRSNPSVIELPPLQSANRPVICYVTDGRDFPPADRERLLLGHIRAALEAGADWVQIREKNIPAKRALALARDAVELASTIAPAAQIFVNDRLDVAIAAGAAGVHLGGGSVLAQEIIAWRSRGNTAADFLVGVSCHSVNEVQCAESAGAEYASFGPIFETPSKLRFGPPQGLARLGEVCRAVKIPIIAIGGITARNAVDCVEAGAKGIAAIRLFQNPTDVDASYDFVSKLHRHV